MQDSIQQINLVREIAREKLRQVSRSDAAMHESFVCRDERFCGIRFHLGRFRAQWMIGEPTIRIFRDDTQIAQVQIGDQAARKVA